MSVATTPTARGIETRKQEELITFLLCQLQQHLPLAVLKLFNFFFYGRMFRPLQQHLPLAVLKLRF